MTIEELLELEQSRNNVDQVIKIVQSNSEAFESLWAIFAQIREPASRRALWAIDIMTEKQHLLNEKHLSFLIEMLPHYKHDGLKRHSLRIIERNYISEKLKGELVHRCFLFLESPSEPVAVKMFSLKILLRIAEEEPLICRELIDIIEIQMEEATPGFRNIGMKTIIKLRTLLSQTDFLT